MNVVTALIISSLTGPIIAAIISKWQRMIYGETCVTPVYFLIGVLPIFGILYVISVVHIESSRSFKTEMREANCLRECNSCGKYSRKYQRNLAAIKSGEDYAICPHENCGHYYSNPVPDEMKWHAIHRDCPKITVWGFIRYRLALNKIEKINENLAEIDSYMAYEKAREATD